MLGSQGSCSAAAILGALALVVAGCSSDSGERATGPMEHENGQVSSKPQNGLATIDPANFTLPVDNPYFPLVPGTTYRHEGMKEGTPAVDVYTVSDKTRQVMGVTNVVVIDKLYVEGHIEEIAHDCVAAETQLPSGIVAGQRLNRLFHFIPHDDSWSFAV